MIFIDRMMICPDKVRQFYCKARQVLQSATIGTKWDRCSSKYANDSRLMNTSCRYIDDNHQYVFRLHCFFFLSLSYGVFTISKLSHSDL